MLIWRWGNRWCLFGLGLGLISPSGIGGKQSADVVDLEKGETGHFEESDVELL